MNDADNLALLGRVMGALIVVLVLIGLAARVARRGRGLKGGSGLRVIDRIGLSREANLTVVEVANRLLLLGVTAQGVTMLADLDAAIASETLAPQSKPESPEVRDRPRADPEPRAQRRPIPTGVALEEYPDLASALRAAGRTSTPATPATPAAAPQTVAPLPKGHQPGAVPHPAYPQGAGQQSRAPQAFVPHAAVPHTAIPYTAVPPAAVPPAAVPPVAVPHTAVPRVAVPQVAVPQAAAPRTRAQARAEVRARASAAAEASARTASQASAYASTQAPPHISAQASTQASTQASAYAAQSASNTPEIDRIPAQRNSSHPQAVASPTTPGSGSVLSPRTWRQGIEALRDLTVRRG